MVNTGSNGGTGAENITKIVTDVVAQVPGVAEMLSGVNLKELIGRLPELKNNGEKKKIA